MKHVLGVLLRLHVVGLALLLGADAMRPGLKGAHEQDWAVTDLQSLLRLGGHAEVRGGISGKALPDVFGGESGSQVSALQKKEDPVAATGAGVADAVDPEDSPAEDDAVVDEAGEGDAPALPELPLAEQAEAAAAAGGDAPAMPPQDDDSSSSGSSATPAPAPPTPGFFKTITMAGFPVKVGEAERDILNGKYVEFPQATVNGKNIFVGGYKNYFYIYYCARDEDWRIGIYVDWGSAVACECAAFAHGVHGNDLLAAFAGGGSPEILFPGVQDGQEWHILLDHTPRVEGVGEQGERAVLPDIGANPFKPVELRSDDGSCTTTTTQAPASGWDLYSHYHYVPQPDKRCPSVPIDDTRAFTLEQPECPMGETKASVMATAQSYCDGQPNCVAYMLSPEWHSGMCAQYCTSFDMMKPSGHRWSVYVKAAGPQPQGSYAPVPAGPATAPKVNLKMNLGFNWNHHEGDSSGVQHHPTVTINGHTVPDEGIVATTSVDGTPDSAAATSGNASADTSQ